MRKLFSDLNLNADIPVRVQPHVGSWGAVRTPTVAERKGMRIKVIIAFIVVTAIVCVMGYQFYTMLMGM